MPVTLRKHDAGRTAPTANAQANAKNRAPGTATRVASPTGCPSTGTARVPPAESEFGAAAAAIAFPCGRARVPIDQTPSTWATSINRSIYVSNYCQRATSATSDNPPPLRESTQSPLTPRRFAKTTCCGRMPNNLRNGLPSRSIESKFSEDRNSHICNVDPSALGPRARLPRF